MIIHPKPHLTAFDRPSTQDDGVPAPIVLLLLEVGARTGHALCHPSNSSG